MTALNGRFDEHHAYVLGSLLAAIDHVQSRIEDLTRHIETSLTELSGPQADGDSERPAPVGGALTPVERLDEIPGIGAITAQIILAEIGLDMSVFPIPGHLVSWAKFSLRTLQSAGKNLPGGTEPPRCVRGLGLLDERPGRGRGGDRGGTVRPRRG
ncbi:transposase [Kitasatospora sp. NPDC051914]|uniref:transposase n=1 Tax=Kitasatospora sp. NPDC051914 TaxID=3154945 RepID=UPI00343A9250